MQNITVTEFPDAPDIESSTSGYADRFTGRVGHWFLSVQERATERAIRQHFGNRKGLSIVDIGGGHGQNVQLLTSLGHQVTVVGSHSSETSQIQTAINSGQVKYVESSLIDLPFPDRSFDVVICYRVLSHMHSWERLCDELMRVSNTLVLLDYPSKRSVNIFIDIFFVWKKRIENNTRRYRIFSDSNVLSQFKRQSWGRAFLCRQYFFPMALHRLAKSRFFSVSVERVSKLLGLTLLFGSPVIAGFVCPEMIDLMLHTETSSMQNKDVS